MKDDAGIIGQAGSGHRQLTDIKEAKMQPSPDVLKWPENHYVEWPSACGEDPVCVAAVQDTTQRRVELYRSDSLGSSSFAGRTFQCRRKAAKGLF